MIEDQIADGDYVVIRRQETASRGDVVVALTDENEATLKRWYPEGNGSGLQPANSSMEPNLRHERQSLGRGDRCRAQGSTSSDPADHR